MLKERGKDTECFILATCPDCLFEYLKIMPSRRPVKIVKLWGHPSTPRGTNILWTTITVNIWDSVSKLFRVLLICELFYCYVNYTFNLGSMLPQNTKYFFSLVFHMLPFHNLDSCCECPHFFHGSPKGYTKQDFSSEKTLIPFPEKLSRYSFQI